MLDKRVQFALDNFLKVEPENQAYKISFAKISYEMEEHSKQGRAHLIFNVGTDNSVCVTNCDNIDWLILRTGD